MAEKQASSFSPRDLNAGYEEALTANSKIERMVGALDEIERRIENLREHAGALEQEKEDLLGALQMLADNRDLLAMSQCKRQIICRLWFSTMCELTMVKQNEFCN